MLFNRKQDIQGMFYHSWKYLSLIQDIFNVKHNSFQYKDDQGKLENLELDFAEGADEILESNSFTGFHEAGPNVDKVFNKWTLEYQKLSRASQGAQDIQSNLSATIDKLPQMTEQKKKIDMHMKIASSMLTEIKSRSIDKLQDIEDEILTTRKLAGENRQDLVNILGISSTEKTQFEDKIRVLIMMILCLKDMAELQSFYDIVQNTHKKIDEVGVLEKVNIMLKKRLNIESQNKQQEESQGGSQAFGFARQLTKGLASGLSNILTDQNNQQNIFAREVK